MMASKRNINEGSSEAVQHKRAAGPDKDDDVYLMTVALLFSKKSPDPKTKVGTCIVNQEGNIVGVGYNKMPNGCEEQGYPWERETESWLDTKFPYVCHAALNAIMNKTSFDVKGCTMYTTLFPCSECAKTIIQSGIKSMVYLFKKNETTPEITASFNMLNAVDITIRQFEAKDQVQALLSSIDLSAK